VVLVGEERKPEPVLSIERELRLRRVRRDADDVHTDAAEILPVVAHVTRLPRATRRIRLGIEVHEELSTSKTVQANGPPALIREGEGGRGISRAEGRHAFTIPAAPNGGIRGIDLGGEAEAQVSGSLDGEGYAQEHRLS
jgi:hypothetical protein